MHPRSRRSLTGGDYGLVSGVRKRAAGTKIRTTNHIQTSDSNTAPRCDIRPPPADDLRPFCPAAERGRRVTVPRTRYHRPRRRSKNVLSKSHPMPMVPLGPAAAASVPAGTRRTADGSNDSCMVANPRYDRPADCNVSKTFIFESRRSSRCIIRTAYY
jgi:hypothetical protein